MTRNARKLRNDWRVCADHGEFTPTLYPTDRIPEGAVPVKIPVSTHDALEGNTALWFYRTFDALPHDEEEHVFLRLEQTGYYTCVYVNGEKVGDFEGAEVPFEFDITPYEKESNLLCIYLYTPDRTYSLRGLNYDNLPTTFMECRLGHEPELYVKPPVSIEDVFVRPDPDTGIVYTEVTLVNLSDGSAEVTLDATLAVHKSPVVNDQKQFTLSLPSGSFTYQFELTAQEDYKLWSVEEPNLYDVILTVSHEKYRNTSITACGFRRLIIDEHGYFIMNGRRFFMKSTHTAYYFPGACDIDTNYESAYKELAYLKICGFNTIRFLRASAHPFQLDICDELGFMVYEEHSMSWLKNDNPETEALFRRTTSAILRRDRNHPSLAMFGTLNETFNYPHLQKHLQAAKEAPTYLRDIAPDTLFLFNSARFDNFKNIASACNPGSYKWDTYMGAESADGEGEDPSAMGDIHAYPGPPYDIGRFEQMEGYATGKPRGVFLSEHGIGSLIDIVGETKWIRQYPDIPYNKNVKGILSAQYDQFLEYFKLHGYDKIYSSPMELIEASERLSSEHRSQLMTLIRRVPGYCGISVSATTDGDGSGEGISDMRQRRKHGMTETLAEDMADLRWCIFLWDSLVYEGGTLKYDVVLSNHNDVLQEKPYTAILTVSGAGGVVYEARFPFTPRVGEDGYIPFAVPVCQGELAIDFPAGEYVLTMDLEDGGFPTAYKKRFTVVKKPCLAGTKVRLFGLKENFGQVLSALGAEICADAPVIIAGEMGITSDIRRDFYRSAEAGAHVIFTSVNAVKKEDTLDELDTPFPGGLLHGYNDWLYHFDNFVHDSYATRALHNRCIMDSEYYRHLYSYWFVSFDRVPDDIGVSTMFLGHQCGTKSRYGFKVCTYKHGAGLVSFVTLRVEDGIGTPAADILMSNLIKGHLSD